MRLSPLDREHVEGSLGGGVGQRVQVGVRTLEIAGIGDRSKPTGHVDYYWRCRSVEERCEGVHDSNYTKHVRLEHSRDIRGCRVRDGHPGTDSGIVHEDVKAAFLSHLLRSSSDRGIVGDVELYESSTELLGCLYAKPWVTGCQPHLVTFGE